MTKAQLKADTKNSLLDAAEVLFGKHGIASASLRAITARAGVNLAAAHYHFGSKEALVRAVISRHLEPMNHRRLELLDAAEAAAEQPRLQAIVRAFVEPVIRHGHGKRGRHFAHLFARAFTAPDGALRSMILDELAEVIQRFKAAFRKSLPHLSEEEMMWRIHFMVGSMAHTMAGASLIEQISGGQCRAHPPDTMIDELVHFATAALSAPGRQGDEP